MRIQVAPYWQRYQPRGNGPQKARVWGPLLFIPEDKAEHPQTFLDTPEQFSKKQSRAYSAFHYKLYKFTDVQEKTARYLLICQIQKCLDTYFY